MSNALPQLAHPQAASQEESDVDRKRLLDSLYAFVGILTPDGTLIDANCAPLEAAGLQLADVAGRKFWDTYWWSHSEEARQAVREACARAAQGEPSRFDIVVRMKNDSRMPIDFMLTPVRDALGRISHLVPSGVDISKREEAERDLQRLNAELEKRVEHRTAALRESEQRFRSAMQHSAIGMALVAPDGRWLDVNRSLCRLLGYSRAELQATTFQALTHPDDLEADLAHLNQLLAGEIASYQMEKRYRHKAGHVVWVQLNVSLVSDGQGVPQYFISQIQDITGRKLLERAMQAVSSELLTLDGPDFYETAARRLAEVLDVDIAFICTLDQRQPDQAETVVMVDGEEVVPNISYKLKGTPCEEVFGGASLIVNDGVPERYPEDTFFVDKGIQSYAAVPLHDLGGAVLGHLCALKRAPLPDALPIEQAMQIFGFAIAAAMTRERTRQQYRDLVEFAPDALVMLDGEGTICLTNERAEELFGWSREELRGKPIEELLPEVAPSEQRGLRDDLLLTAESRATGGVRVEIQARRKEGPDFPVEISASPMETEQGTMIAAVVRDVTERRAIEEQLRQSQRLDAIGKLTGGVAHDFNNLLTVILGNTEVLEEELEGNEELSRLANTVKTAAIRGADLTRRLLVFSRKQTLDPKPTDVEALLGVMRDLLRRTLGEHIETKMVVQGPLWPVQVDGPQLENAILNLCINARDAMPDGGRLTIETRNVHLEPDVAALQGDMKPGDYLMLKISDNGAGMDRDTLTHAFEPFYTTKDIGKGSGLGLSMVYGFITQSRGHVGLTSEPGRGTEVTIYLPRSLQPSEAPVEAGVDELRGGSESILVVEDDELVCAHVASQLSALGYNVTTAADGPEAAAILESGWEFDLLLTDMVMPGGMTGRQLGEWAQQLIPGLPVLLSSGYSESTIQQDVLKTGFHLLSKPYRRHQLATKVRDILDTRAAAAVAE